MANTYDLAGRVAVVTGGAQGIGRAVASRLAASGAKVALWDRDTALAEKTASEIGGKDAVFAVPCDMTDFASVTAAAAATVKTAGSPSGTAATASASARRIIQAPLSEWTAIQTRPAIACKRFGYRF